MSDVGRRQRRHEPSVFHDPDAGSRFLRTKQIVRRHQHGDAAVAHLLEQRGEFIRGLRVEARRRLVEEERFGFLRDGDRDADLLPHALRVRGDALILCAGRQADLAEQVDERAAWILVTGERGEVLGVLEPVRLR
jgi:hypothetical protein